MDYGNLDGEVDENRLDKSLGCWVPKIKHREFAGDVQYKWIYIYTVNGRYQDAPISGHSE
jgi:hypothetical protein